MEMNSKVTSIPWGNLNKFSDLDLANLRLLDNRKANGFHSVINVAGKLFDMSCEVKKKIFCSLTEKTTHKILEVQCQFDRNEKLICGNFIEVPTLIDTVKTSISQTARQNLGIQEIYQAAGDIISRTGQGMYNRAGNAINQSMGLWNRVGTRGGLGAQLGLALFPLAVIFWLTWKRAARVEIHLKPTIVNNRISPFKPLLPRARRNVLLSTSPKIARPS